MLEAKLNLDILEKCISLEHHIEIVEDNELNSKVSQILQDKVDEERAIWNNISRSIVNRLHSYNVGRINSSWYAIRYIDTKGVIRIKIVTLLNSEVHLVSRSLKNQRDMTRASLVALLPCMIDLEVDLSYTTMVHDKALVYLEDLCNSVVEKPNKINVSDHASKRWVQRKIKITNSIKIEEYKRTHVKEIEEEIRHEFSLAKQIWKDSEADYYFDNDNMVYIVRNHNIVTVYEEDFGFNHSINRSIVEGQVECMVDKLKEFNECSKTMQVAISRNAIELSSVLADIARLNSQLALTSITQKRLLVEKEEYDKRMSLSKEEFDIEFNKLFKRWKS